MRRRGLRNSRWNQFSPMVVKESARGQRGGAPACRVVARKRRTSGSGQTKERKASFSSERKGREGERAKMVQEEVVVNSRTG